MRSQQPPQRPQDQPPNPTQSQREALKRSEERASRDQPRSFDKRNLEDKIVEIPPKEETNEPIRGLDPDDKR
ncbi:MAG: hypothetical protein ABI702_08775 [Burkholderiales bacterium]